jgi:hypothetical protein
MKPFFSFLLAGGLATALPLSATNLLQHADPVQWGGAGAVPPRPWQHSDRDDGISVRSVEHEGALWLELRDDSNDKSANIRQEFTPLRAGRLSFRLTLARDHLGEFGIYLGQGNASAPVERIVDIKSSGRGVLMLGSAGERVPTGAQIAPGVRDHLFVEFRPVGHDLHLRLGRIGPGGADIILGETTAPHQAHPVTRLRITTDNAPIGARVLVSDIVLTALE